MTDKTPRRSDPCIMVIFGAAGDLTKRKLIPALCNLAQDGFLADQFAIVGFAYNDFTTESLRARLTEDIKNFATSPVDAAVWKRIIERFHYVRADFGDPNGYKRLGDTLAQLSKDHGIPENHFYYMAVAPRFFGEI